ncbi:cytochrome c-type biogenesis protein CcmH [Filomicrobium insigne]|uniref:Cytochrome c-type biogenesis protein CcmH n=1 Tax=Filomicrobium insigne TaxID=418854 RepID=A0A1H0SWI2_9HYPH|nr:c-type cytochrome biogenesis protein CcmI [Filomicrobium insigne]SDP46192.1 cytochrome c-type biogenesis protein CcmH [Filomicrobium insigne]
MVLWIGFAALTAAVIAVITRPLLSARVQAAASRQADLAVYRDQMAEIEAERARGLIEAAEAESARAELGRRVLAVAGSGQGDDTGTTGIGERYRSWVSVASAVLIALAGAGVYLSLGAPDLPSKPHAARLTTPNQNATVADLIGRVEAELRAHPEDGRGWDVLAPVYLRLQRFAEAANAYAQAIRLQGESPKRLAGFAEATILDNDGIVTEPARKAYQRLLESQPDFAEARFWLAVALEQDGKGDAAADAYRALLASAPEDARWKEVVAQRLATVTRQPVEAGNENKAEDKTAAVQPNGLPESSETPRGPSAADIAAAQSMTAEQRSQFISQMVTQLAARLEQKPDDLAGWIRLVRAYTVLGRKDDALAALDRARKTFPDGSENRAALDGLAVELGLGT